jgi:hypothetical protein
MDDEYKEILYRLDERTERIDGRIQRLEHKMEVQDAQVRADIAAIDAEVDALRDRVERNTTILTAVTFGLGTTLSAVLLKIVEIIPFRF